MAQETARANIDEAQSKMKSTYNKKATEVKLTVGDNVWTQRVRMMPTGSPLVTKTGMTRSSHSGDETSMSIRNLRD